VVGLRPDSLEELTALPRPLAGFRGREGKDRREVNREEKGKAKDKVLTVMKISYLRPCSVTLRCVVNIGLHVVTPGTLQRVSLMYS